MVLIEPASSANSGSSPRVCSTVASRSPAAIRRVAVTAATRGLVKRRARAAATNAATSNATRADQGEEAEPARRFVDRPRDDQHRGVAGDRRQRGGDRGVDEVGARAPADLVTRLQRRDVEIGGGDPRGEGAGERPAGVERDHLDRREVTGLAHHRELAPDAGLRDRGALGEGRRDGLSLTGQLLLRGRNRRALDEVVAHQSGRDQGECDEQHHGDGEAASHPSRYPTPQTVARGRSSPSFLRS